jgi:hypothetical protein
LILQDIQETPIPELPITPDHEDTGETAAILPKKPRNQHLKSENPKNNGFTGRATDNEAYIIRKAIAARKKQLQLSENEPYDIVRLTLDLIKKNNSDFLSPIKTK